MWLCWLLQCYCVMVSFAHVLFVSRPTAPTSCTGSAAGPAGPEDRNTKRNLTCRPRTARRRNARRAVHAGLRPPTTMVAKVCVRYSGQKMVCAYTVLPLSTQTLCELHRHVASPNDIIFSIRRLHSEHLHRAHAVASNLSTMLFCIPS